MVRIAIGGLMHGSNTFAATRTDLAAFESGIVETGAGIVERWGEAHHEVGGFLEAAERLGFEAVPTFMAWAASAGPVTADAYGALSDRLIQSLQDAGRVDGVLLALHGAMVAEGQADADGAILARVRDLIGPARPLIATLDTHANVSPLMAGASDALIAYRTNPHLDQRARGQKAAEMALQAACGRIRPIQALSKPPILVPLLAQETALEPLSGLMSELDDLDRTPGVLDASLLLGFLHADVAATGPACVVVADDAPALASQLAQHLSARLWAARHQFAATAFEPTDAVARALASTETPVLLLDVGDNVGFGAAGDSTVLIHELLRREATGVIVVLHDPEAVQACAAAGIGSEVSLAVGGKVERHAPPLPIVGRVRVLHDGQYVEDLPRHGGHRINDQGLTAVVELPDENAVVLTSRPHPPYSLGQLTSLGLRPESARVLVVKSAVGYKPAYEPIVGTMVAADTPGPTASDPARFAYRNLRRPIYPLDPEPLVEAALQ